MQARIDKLVEKFDLLGIDAVIVMNPYNRRYLTGFTGTSGYAVISRSRRIFMTDSRYTEQAAQECRSYEIVMMERGTVEDILDVLKSMNYCKLGFEDNYLTVQRFNSLRDGLKDIELVPIGSIIEKIREIKDKEEINRIKKAAATADNAFSHILGVIKPGISEQDVALELEYFMKKSGASALSFDTIVASGQRSSMPHGVATNKKIEYGDTVVLDFGCIFEGYCSDMTRTVFVGKADDEIRKIYEIVLKAQKAALDLIKPEVACKDVDLQARKIIEDMGYGKNFGHGLGHSVGLEIHEEPRLSTKSEGILKPDMVVTVEPGIYVEGFGGVRIEDLVVVTENGLENFTSSRKDIIIV